MTRTGPCPYHRTVLTPVRDIPTYAVIIRSIHERGPTQDEALAELTRRGTWLTTEQRRQAGLSDHEGWTKPAFPGDAVRFMSLRRDGEIGDVRIQQYAPDKNRVGTFLPGVLVELPGDSPKMEPDRSQWCNSATVADVVFNEFVRAAFEARWSDK